MKSVYSENLALLLILGFMGTMARVVKNVYSSLSDAGEIPFCLLSGSEGKYHHCTWAMLWSVTVQSRLGFVEC